MKGSGSTGLCLNSYIPELIIIVSILIQQRIVHACLPVAIKPKVPKT